MEAEVEFLGKYWGTTQIGRPLLIANVSKQLLGEAFLLVMSVSRVSLFISLCLHLRFVPVICFPASWILLFDFSCVVDVNIVFLAGNYLLSFLCKMHGKQFLFVNLYQAVSCCSLCWHLHCSSELINHCMQLLTTMAAWLECIYMYCNGICLCLHHGCLIQRKLY